MRYLLLINLFTLGTVLADSKLPQTTLELWNQVDLESARVPLDVEILKTWEEDGIVLNIVRFTVGVWKGKKSKLAGYYAYPKGGENLPAIVQTNGGGQIASTHGPKKWAARGYACFNPNNGAKAWDKSIPNTDWGALKPGLPGDKRNGKGPLAPGPYTIDDFVSPRNHQWFPRMVGARRAISFLQSRPEVNPELIGIRGHSTGGVMTVYESVDPRVKAAVPSVGGNGFWNENYPEVSGNLRGNGGADEKQWEYFMRVMSCDAHWKIMHAPVLFLGASNDFNSPTDNVWRALSSVQHKNRNWVLAPHYNHRFNESAGIADLMWFETHLKKKFIYPNLPHAELILKTVDGTPEFIVKPDPLSKHKIKSVDIYYSYGRNPVGRYWSDGFAKNKNDLWVGKCPIMYTNEPLFVFANVTYKIDYKVNAETSVPELMVTSSFHTATSEELKKAGVRETAVHSREIENFDTSLKDWVGSLNFKNKKSWVIETRKIKDPRWIGPKGAKLVFEVNGPKNSLLGLSIGRRNRSANGGKAKFYAFVQLNENGWNKIEMTPDQFQNIVGEKLDYWHMAENLTIGDGMSLVNEKKKFLPRAGKAAVPAIPTTISQWKSSYYQSSDDTYTKDLVDGDLINAKGLLKNMRWEGGEVIKNLKPWTIKN